jgi:hypothetical protein
MRVIRPESLYPFCRSCAGFSPPCRRSMHGRGSNHDVFGHKKRYNIPPWKYTIMSDAMSIRLVEGGTSEGCRPKLPRWPFSGSGCTQASGTAGHGSMVGSHVRRVKLFYAAPRIFAAPRAERLVAAVLPPALCCRHFASRTPSHRTVSLCVSAASMYGVTIPQRQQ